MQEGLLDNIKEIKSLSFFDDQEVSSRSWTVDDFVREQNKFSIKVAAKLNKRISGMETSLQVFGKYLRQSDNFSRNVLPLEMKKQLYRILLPLNWPL